MCHNKSTDLNSSQVFRGAAMSSPAHHTIVPRGDGTSYLSSGGVKGLSISVVFTTLATCFVLARLYTRTRLMDRMESNDWMIVIALVRH